MTALLAQMMDALIWGAAGFFALLGVVGGILFQKSKLDQQRAQARRSREAQLSRAHEKAARLISSRSEKQERKNHYFGTRERNRLVKRARRSAEKRAVVENLQEEFDERRSQIQSKTDKNKLCKREVASAEGHVDALRTELNSILEKQIEALLEKTGQTYDETKALLLENLEREIKGEMERERVEVLSEAELSARDLSNQVVDVINSRIRVKYINESKSPHININDKRLHELLLADDQAALKLLSELTQTEVNWDAERATVSISVYDGVKREVARRLVGRIMKTKKVDRAYLEKTLDQIRKEVEREMDRAGGKVVKSLKIKDVHKDMVDLTGRLKYRTSYGQNVLDHIHEVSEIAGIMASELGLDPVLSKRSALLHDIGKAIDVETEGPHPKLGAEFAHKYGEDKVVLHAIACHHDDPDPKYPYTVMTTTSDALSGGRPGARREAVDSYVERIEALEGIACQHDGVNDAFAIQAGRELQVVVNPQKVDDQRADELSRLIAEEIEEKLTYPGEVRVVVMRDVKASAVAN